MCNPNWDSENDFVGKWILDPSGTKTFEIESMDNKLKYHYLSSPQELASASYTPAQNGDPAHVDVADKTFAFVPDGCEGSQRRLRVVNAENLNLAATPVSEVHVPTEGERYIEEE